MTDPAQPRDLNGNVISLVFKPTSGSSQDLVPGEATTAFSGRNVVRVVLTTAGWIAIKSTGSATVTDTYMPANVPELFKVLDADTVVVHFPTAVGTAYVDTMS